MHFRVRDRTGVRKYYYEKNIEQVKNVAIHMVHKNQYYKIKHKSYWKGDWALHQKSLRRNSPLKWSLRWKHDQKSLCQKS